MASALSHLSLSSLSIGAPLSSIGISLPRLSFPVPLSGLGGVTAVNAPLDLWVILLVIVAAVALLALAMRGGLGSLSWPRLRGRKSGVKVKAPREVQAATEQQAPAAGLQWPGVSVYPLTGWGGSRYIKLDVDEDLPLIWREGEPLTFSAKQDGVSLVLEPEGEVRDGSIVFSSPGCHEIRVVAGGGTVEAHRILVVREYAENVIASFRANMASAGSAAIEEKTPREICSQMSRMGMLDGQACAGWRSLRVFEDARYGGYHVKRPVYEEFLRGLKALRDAVIMGCR